MLISSSIKTGLVAAALIHHVSAGFGFKSTRQAAEVVAPNRSPRELAVSEPAQSDRKTSLATSMADVQQMMDSIANMPTCNMVATKNLVHSCESFQDRRDGQLSGDHQLESYQELFAIRVTGCEMYNAHHDMPVVCQPLQDPDLRGMPHKRDIQKCLKALASIGTNHWTTYNRVKQSGLIMCHTLRAQADKDDLIHLHKILFGAITDVNGAIILQKDELEAFGAHFSEIISQVKDFRNALHEENQEIKAGLKGFSNDLQDNMVIIMEVYTDRFVSLPEYS